MDHAERLLYFSLYICLSFSQSFVTLDCKHSVMGTFADDTKLPCTFKSTKVKTFSSIELSKFEKDGNQIYVFKSQAGVKGPQNRIKLLHPDSQDVSLVIQKTQLIDQGTYRYFLETSSGYDYQDITLKVIAPYSLPKVILSPNVTRRMRTTNLICETTGYPLAQIHWFVYERKNLTSEAKTFSVETPQGLFKITSTLPIRVAESALEGNYTCAVWNMEEQVYKVKKHFPIPFLDEPNTHRQSERRKNKVLIAVFVIVGALGLGIIILTIFRFRRNFYLAIRRESWMPMMPRGQKADA
ncbi:CD276 antigen-like [Carcharodon carcharias]|uniref:CD276 antigen-like n=1 Tax=Carcharodon carcharias TaxID=13397 RepID=UPI001B7EA995|nr:CD276 antigen-like [Carcharodon carcharias]XP_041073036.1 CD276 antigen-like [Carcharodon carcharias]XP_041073037.1 CD276 antigen-like [Carcharodon carcharias]